MSESDRGRVRDRVDAAYRLQTQAGILGALRWTSVGVGAAILAHYSWPAFRRQTLAFKAFLVSGFGIYGLCTGAENALITHEMETRKISSMVRREAAIDLGRRGLVPTETAIKKWIEERRQQEAERET